jgi:ankyrin repeat protein
MITELIQRALETREEDVISTILIDPDSETINELISWKDEKGYTLLHVASFYNWIHLLEFLLKYMPSERWQDSSNLFGESPLHRCARMGHVFVAYKLFQTEKISSHMIDKEGCTAFHRACQCGRRELCLFLYYYYYSEQLVPFKKMEHDFFNQRDNLGRTPLLISCSYSISDDKMHSLLLRLSSNPYELHSLTKMTAPHYLAKNQSYNYLKWIQKHPIDLYSKNSDGKTVLDLIENPKAKRYLIRIHTLKIHPYRSHIYLWTLGILFYLLPLSLIYLGESYGLSLVGLLVASGMIYYGYFGSGRGEWEEIQEMMSSITMSYVIVLSLILLFMMIPEDKYLLHCLTLLTLISTWLSFIKLLFSSPGYIEKLSREEEGRLILKLASENRLTSKQYCTTCGCFRLKDSKHCRFCDRCVLEMDHHCIMLAICVGKYNRVVFLLFMIFLFVCGWIAVRNIVHIVILTPFWKTISFFILWSNFWLGVMLIVKLYNWYIIRMDVFKKFKNLLFNLKPKL